MRGALLVFAALAAFGLISGTQLLTALAWKGLVLALGGVVGYWLDRGLFPYGRPHTCLDFDQAGDLAPSAEDLAMSGFSPTAFGEQSATYRQVATSDYHWSMLRRAVVVAACVLGAAISGGHP